MSYRLIVALTLMMGASSAWAQASNFTMARSIDAKATVRVANQSQSVPTLINVVVSGGDVAGSEMTLDSLTLAAFGVRQKVLSNKEPTGKPTGVLSFVKTPGHVDAKYDRDRRTLVATASGRVHFPQMDEIAPPRPNPKDDDVESVTQSATVEARLTFDEPLPERPNNEMLRARAKMELKVRVEALPNLRVNEYTILVETLVTLDFAWVDHMRVELVRDLCLQPVRIRSSATDTSPTGAGLGFGLPTARAEWRKADVTFTVREFKTVTSAALKVLSEGEADTLRSNVQDDDCVEIFFVENLSPVSMWGGGATWSGGQASTQIISSDGMVPAGIDLHHIAHELSHAMTLKHPGDGTATRPAGSTGTLVCPSGWLHDNPDANSAANHDNVANPLFRLGWRSAGASPDCDDDGDCGPCY